MGKIVGPGSLIVDLTGFAPHLPVGGETVMGSRFQMGPGGKGNNQMTAAARAGATVKLIGCWGKDALGASLKEHYQREKMSTEYIKLSETESTGVALIEVDESCAQNRIIVILAANDLVSGDDVYAAEKDFADCDVVLTQFETGQESVKAAIALAKKYHKPIVLNPAPFVKTPPSFYDGIDYLTPNETEAEFITGVKILSPADAKKAAEVLLSMGVKKAVITLGKQGSYFFDGTNELHLPCLPLKAVDSTGAGDAFSGGLAAALAEGMDDVTAMQFASCTSNLAVTKPGTAPAMPTREEIVALMKSAYGVEL